MSILLLGQAGYIGQAFITEMNRRDIRYQALSRSAVDYTDFTILRTVLQSLKPDLVVNCAAFVATPSVDLNEQDKAKTLMANTVFAETLVNACELTHTPLLHVSTGCLFNHPPNHDGYAFKETDAPMLTMDRGAGIYVSSKQLAETIVARHPGAYICRIRLPFDEFDHPRNYLTKLMTYPKVLDALNSISHRGDFVKACLDLWDLRAPWGTYHVTNGGAIWAREICAELADAGLKMAFDFWDWDEFMASVAKTTKSNAILDNTKLLSVGVKMRNINDAVMEAVTNWKVEAHA